MPTTRQRYQVTESDELARALDAGCRRWPDESRGRVLVRLALAGAAQLDSPIERRLALAQALAQLPPVVAQAYRGSDSDLEWADWPE
jgi:hypothetical protein